MATTEAQTITMLRNLGPITFAEAIEVMKIVDKHPTTIAPVRWKDYKTGKPVSIGYT